MDESRIYNKKFINLKKIKKKIQNAFKFFSYKAFTLLHGKIKGKINFNSYRKSLSYIQNKIMKAEAVWFAGGNQWNYVSYWRDSPIDSLVNDAMQNRNIVIGVTIEEI